VTNLNLVDLRCCCRTAPRLVRKDEERSDESCEAILFIDVLSISFQFYVLLVRDMSVSRGNNADVPMCSPSHLSTLLRSNDPDRNCRTLASTALRRLPGANPQTQRATRICRTDDAQSTGRSGRPAGGRRGPGQLDGRCQTAAGGIGSEARKLLDGASCRRRRRHEASFRHIDRRAGGPTHRRRRQNCGGGY